MISLEQIKVTFSPDTVTEKKALQGITLNFKAGEFVTLIGSNGAGKSTFLNLIAGEVRPTSGTIRIDGKDVTHLTTHERAMSVARVFQDPKAGTCGDLTLAENLALALKRGKKRGLSSGLNSVLEKEFRDQLASLNLNLENRMETPMKLFSGGQRQAVSLLMATVSPLKVLLLDEHTAALDPKTAESILELTENLVREKKLCALMVTHSLQHALKYGTRTVMLHEGRVLCDLPNELRKQMSVQDLMNKYGTILDQDNLLLNRALTDSTRN